MESKTLIILIAIAGIVILESIALFNGIDGALLMSSFAIVGGLGGYELKEQQNNIKAIKEGT